ncbi:hypothetical protein [Paenibacillus polymyxa]|uniref:hypothetical protein n=1 Tax=Paenibacillus polymyxa TaxID=1406 RepID=UPI002AB4882F|nr:hypothetical protein [Paenibacillus polymyxa]MDY8021089.1 hypothetical protein [Paenibacillus polymyxa]
MKNKHLEELFYSDEMESIRLAYYDEAYKQGRFDERIDKTYLMDRYKLNIKPMHLQSEEYQLSSIQAAYNDEDEN